MTRSRRGTRNALLAALLGLAACGETAPEVEVRTYVGNTFERRSPELQRAAILEVLQTLLPAPAAPEAGHDEADVRTAPTHPPRDRAEFEALQDEIRRGPIDELGGPARRLAEAPASSWPAIREALLADRRAPKGDYRTVLAVIGGDVPDRYGHFAIAWKKKHGHPVLLSEDWFEDLLAMPRSRISAPLLPVYRDCVLQTALLRAARNLGRDPALADAVVETLLDAAYHHHGTFRDEVSRALADVGAEGIPALVRATAWTDADGGEDPRAAFARFLLDKVDRLHPRRAIDAVRSDPRQLARVLGAYGHARMGEAAEVLLEFADDRSPSVRASARAAFEAFVTGPAPKVAQRSVRLLGGATTTARAFLTYRARATLAIRERLETAAPDRVEPPCELYREGVLDPECEAQPLRLTQAYFAWLDEQRRARNEAILDEALASADPALAMAKINRMLAEDPELEGRERLIPFIRARAEALEAEGLRAEAAVEFRKAAMLARADDPGLADALTVRALLDEAESPGLEAHGREMLIRTAVERQPTAPGPRDALAQVQREASVALAGPIPTRTWVTALAALAAVFAGLALVGRVLRRLVFARARPGA